MQNFDLFALFSEPLFVTLRNKVDVGILALKTSIQGTHFMEIIQKLKGPMQIDL